MTTRRRRIGLALLVVLLVGAIVHGLTWFAVSGQIAAAWPAYIAAAAQDGWQIEAGPPRRTGWPWTAAVDVPGLVVTRLPATTASLRWTADQLRLAIAPADPHTLAISPSGPQTLRLADDHPLALRASAATLSVALAGDRPATLLIQGFTATHPYGGAVAIGRIEARFDPTAMTLSATPIRPTPPLAAPFDGGATLALRALLNHPIPAASSPFAAATAWRAAGGQLTVPELTLGWPSAEASGTATGTLDANLQLRIVASLRVRGAPEIIDAAARTGLIQPGPAAAARAVIQLLALARPGAPVSLPVILQDGVLTIAQFPTFRFPVIGWVAP